MFAQLVKSFIQLLERKLNPLGRMDVQEQIEEAIEHVSAAQDFEQLHEALRRLSFDRGIRIRLKDLEACAAERAWLSERSAAFLQDWYATCAEDVRRTRSVAQMVKDVAQALSTYRPGGKGPDTRHWDEKQRQLWTLEHAE